MSVTDPPRAVADRFFAALERADWLAAVAECDGDGLTEFRDRSLAVLAAHRQFVANPPSGSGGAVLDRDMTAAAFAQVGDTPMYGFRSPHTLAEAAALPGPVFLSHYLAALDEVYGEVSTPRRVVGVVQENDALAHVLYRRDDAARRKRGRLGRGQGPPPSWVVTVLTLRERDGDWRALLDREIVSDSLDFIQSFLAPEWSEDQSAAG
ncbi:MAG TPA: hypothetical protein VG432_17885 [Gemmatimonadaceae bacterium]|nr:hypothetical protein [Gemmatimonadaceae bacterium]